MNMFIKNPIKVVAIIAVLASVSFVSCQKEAIAPTTSNPIEEPTAYISAKTWLLLDQNWTVAVLPGQNGASNLTITRGATIVSAASSTFSSLPTLVSNELIKRGIAVNNTLTVWAITAGGGWLIEVPADANGVKKIFWFNGQNTIKSIGTEQG